MSKYIKATDAAEICSDKHNIPLSELVDTFADIPTADVVEVVRCKDCKNYIYLDDVDRDMCKRNAVYNDICKEYHGLCAVKKTHFCSYGERKDEK